MRLKSSVAEFTTRHAVRARFASMMLLTAATLVKVDLIVRLTAFPR